MKHKKISGIANTAPEKVGGADWDDDHAYAIGDFFVVGTARWKITPTAHVSGWVASGRINNDQSLVGNVVIFTVNNDFPRVANSYINTWGTISLVGRDGSIPTNIWVVFSCDSSGNVQVNFANGRPASVTVDVFVTIYGECLAL